MPTPYAAHCQLRQSERPTRSRSFPRLQFFDRVGLDREKCRGYSGARTMSWPASFRSGWLAAIVIGLVLASARAAAQDAPRAEIVAPVQLDETPVPYPD